MISFKVMFRSAKKANEQGEIVYKISRDRKVRYIDTNYHLFASEWDNRRSMVSVNENASSLRTAELMLIRKQIRCDMERVARIERRLLNEKLNYALDDVQDEFYSFVEECSLVTFMRNVIKGLMRKGKVRSTETYRVTLNNFTAFLMFNGRNGGYGEDVLLDAVDSDLMEAYEAWQKNRGIKPNTISFYMRILRAVYNRAVERGLIDNCYPFRHVYTGIDKTVKRALPLAVMRKIMMLNLADDRKLDFARDMFMLSFMLRGMSFVDMAFLKKSDLCGGYVQYQRRKTGQLLVVRWTAEMQQILSKYPVNESQYLLPIIRTSQCNERCTYRNVGYNINYNLKRIASMVGVTVPLTLYVARHSWASIAKMKGVPLNVISEGMGHDSEATTQIYLASLDTARVDRANRLILKSLKR